VGIIGREKEGRSRIRVVIEDRWLKESCEFMEAILPKMIERSKKAFH